MEEPWDLVWFSDSGGFGVAEMWAQTIEQDLGLARRWVSDGVWFVSPAQTAEDCPTGSGRMRAEGEALVEWMQSHEDRRRAIDFAASPDPLSP